MSIDRTRHLTGNSGGLTAGSDDSLRGGKEHARERRMPSHDAAQSFANLMQSEPDDGSEQSSEDEVEEGLEQPSEQGLVHGSAQGSVQRSVHGSAQGSQQALHGNVPQEAFQWHKQLPKRADKHAEEHGDHQADKYADKQADKRPDKRPDKHAPLPDVFSLFARPTPTGMETATPMVPSTPPRSALGEEMTTLIAASLSADASLTSFTIDALRVDADGGQSIEIDVGSQSTELHGLTIRLAECEGRLQVDFRVRNTPLFERLEKEIESIAHTLHDRLSRAVLVRVEQVGGGTSSPVALLVG